MNRRYLLALLSLVAAIAVLAAGCTHGASSSKYIRDQSKLTERYAEHLTSAVPYPIAQMKDSVERRNLRERLLRFNRPDKVGYVYILGLSGKVVGYYTIEGKVSSTDSHLTVTQQIAEQCTRRHCYGAAVDSMGDDGSFGPNEHGVFFFTTNGVLVETSMDFIYSDSPLPLEAPKLNPQKGQSDISQRH